MDSRNTKRKKSPPCMSLVKLHDHQLLSAVAEFLVLPSRALLAVALTAPTTSIKWQCDNMQPAHLSEATKGLLAFGTCESNGLWERIEFDCAEVRLGKNLTDEDLCAVLGCIKAAGYYVKRLGLGNKLWIRMCSSSMHGKWFKPLCASLIEKDWGKLQGQKPVLHMNFDKETYTPHGTRSAEEVVELVYIVYRKCGSTHEEAFQLAYEGIEDDDEFGHPADKHRIT